MYTHYQPNTLTINWTIYRGVSTTKEDFSRAEASAFVFSRNDKINVPCSQQDGVITLIIPSGLSPDVYSLQLIWTKNDGRSLARAIYENAFAVTEYPDEATERGGTPPADPLQFKSSAGTFGYDGLSAYEIAVLKHLTTKSENQWIQAAVDNAEAEEARVAAENTRKTAESVRDSSFRQLSHDMQEAIAGNIKSIIQTTTSTESGGENVITVTKQDDTTTTFSIYNGAQGEQGIQGPQGEQGEQGESGVSLGEVAVVDNLTTNDSSKVLSAKQGYLLNNRVTNHMKFYNYLPCYDLSHPIIVRAASSNEVSLGCESRNGLGKYVAGTITKGTDMVSVGATHYMAFNLQGGQGGASSKYTLLAQLFPASFRRRFFSQKRLRIMFDALTNSNSSVTAKVTIWLNGYTAESGSTTTKNTKREVQITLASGVINHIDVTLDDMFSWGTNVIDPDRLVEAKLYIYTANLTDVDVKLCNLIVTDELEGVADNQIRLYKENPYEGKRFIFIGDSYSTGLWFWDSFLELDYGITNIRTFYNPADNKKPAQAGASVSCDSNGMSTNGNGTYSIWYKCAENRMSDFDFDVINLFGGINDNYLYYGFPLGTVDDKPYVDDADEFATPANYVDAWASTLTFAQFYMGCIEMLKRDFPTKEIILCTLMPTVGGLTADSNTGMSMGESKSALILRIAKKYNLKVVPWYWSVMSENTYTIESFQRQGLHPEPHCARIMAARWAEVLGLKAK